MQPEQAERIAELVEQAFELKGAERAGFLAQRLRPTMRSCARSGSASPRRGASRKVDVHVRRRIRSRAVRRRCYERRTHRAARCSGEYRIISLLGEGGMGEVYLADDTHFGRQVAIKLIKQGFGTKEFVRHFRQEERILAALNHPNIARLYGGAVTSRRPALFRDGIRGGNSARDLCRRAFAWHGASGSLFFARFARPFPTRTKISSSIAISSRPISGSPQKANRSFWISASRACSIPKRRRRMTKPS